MQLRDYQSSLYTRVRSAFASGCRRVCLQLATGGGKTAIFVQMAVSSQARGNRVWIVVPRVELLRQAASMLSGSGVEHGYIAAGYPVTDRAVTLASSDTILRRLDNVDTGPEFLIIDEAHLHYRRARELMARFPQTKIVGVTATPERLDGRGLSDIYDVLIEGPPLPDLIADGYLVPPVYYAPPIDGLDDVHRRGTEYDSAELHDLLTRRNVYGSAVEHYGDLAYGRSAIVFCRNIDAAETAARKFREAGFNFEAVSSRTLPERRRELVERLRSGDLTGICNCEIATYGLDVPRVSAIVLLRPTTSKALQVQMIGRGLRTAPGKQDCIVLDHVGMLAEFGHPLAPHSWNFTGNERRQRSPDPGIRLRLCPETYLYCERASCIGCDKNTTGRKSRAEHVVDCRLALVDSPLAEPGEVASEVVDRLGLAIARAREHVTDANVREAVRLGKMLGHQPLRTAHEIGISKALLESIERVCEYAPGWSRIQMRIRMKRRSR